MSVVRRLRSVTVDVGQLDDVELLARLRSDEACLRVLIDRHHRSLHRFATAMLHNRFDADEAVQDTFIAAHRSANGFRGESSVRTWLHTICYRQCLTRLRRKRVDTTPIIDDVYPATGAGDLTFNLALETAVRALPETNRVAFVLVDVLGFSREDAADLVGIPGNTMRARVARARMLLADALNGDTDISNESDGGES